MALWQGRSKRKSTGGRLSLHRGKKRFEIGRELQEVKVGGTTKKIARARGGRRKNRLLRAEYVSITGVELIGICYIFRNRNRIDGGFRDQS